MIVEDSSYFHLKAATLINGKRKQLLQALTLKRDTILKHYLQVCLILYSSKRPELMNDKYYFYIIHYYLLPGDRSSAHKSPALRISPQHHNITTSQLHNCISTSTQTWLLPSHVGAGVQALVSGVVIMVCTHCGSF